MFYLWFGGLLVFAGDLVHTIAFTITIYTGDPKGTAEIADKMFEVPTFAMFFDGLIFMVYYFLWSLLIVDRYQKDKFYIYDKAVFTMAFTAMTHILPGAVPNDFGIYTLEYNISIFSPRSFLFVIFGLMTVVKLVHQSGNAIKAANDSVIARRGNISFLCRHKFFNLISFFLSYPCSYPGKSKIWFDDGPKDLCLYQRFYMSDKRIAEKSVCSFSF